MTGKELREFTNEDREVVILTSDGYLEKIDRCTLTYTGEKLLVLEGTRKWEKK